MGIARFRVEGAKLIERNEQMPASVSRKKFAYLKNARIPRTITTAAATYFFVPADRVFLSSINLPAI